MKGWKIEAADRTHWFEIVGDKRTANELKDEIQEQYPTLNIVVRRV